MARAQNQTIGALTINDLSVTWDERPRRVEKPCVVCRNATRGRMDNGSGLKQPAHISCAMKSTINKALRIYKQKV